MDINAERDFVIFSTADWDEPYWTNKQHTASHLAAAGHRVLYVESVGLRPPKLGSGRDLGRMWARLKRNLKGPRKVHDNIWVYSPLVIPFKHHFSVVRMLNQWILRSAVGWFLAKEKFKRAIVWTYHPYMLESVNKSRVQTLVYHCVDDLSVIPGVDPGYFKSQERRLLKLCDIAFVTSHSLYNECHKYNDNTHFMPNVADVEHFGQALNAGEIPIDLADIPEPRLGYIGVLSDFKVDFDLIYAIAIEKPDWQWVFIGEEREGQSSSLVKKMRCLPNIHFLGRKDYSLLPEYMRGLSVGMLPSIINQYTRSMFPMKYFEYLAAGLPVVSTPLDFTKRYTAGMEVAENVDEMLLSISSQLQSGRFSPQESRRLVGDNTWQQRLKKMLSFL